MTVPDNQPDDRFVSSIEAVAARIGVDRRTVQTWLYTGAPSKTSRGYDVPAIEEWRALTLRNSPASSHTDEDTALLKRRRLLANTLEDEAKARLRGFEAEKTTEDVVHLDQVEQFLAGLFTEFRRQLARVPKQMGPAFPEEHREQLQTELTDQLALVGKSMHGYCLRATELRDES